MNHTEITRRRASLKTSAGAALLALAAVAAAGVVHAEQGATAAACQQETRRVAVWPISPRAQQIARFEQREVTVCDGKVVSRKAAKREAATAAN